MYKDLDRKQDVGHFFCLLNIAAFLDLVEFKQRIDETIDRIKASKRRPGVEEILIPGERSSRNVKLNLVRGIAVSDETLVELQQWCTRLNTPFDCVEGNV